MPGLCQKGRSPIDYQKAGRLLFILVIMTLSAGYVRNVSPSGSAVQWPTTVSTIDVYVNSSNAQGLDENFVQTQAAHSVNQWNGNSRITIRKNSTTGSGQTMFNEIYFSTDPTVFSGTGVVGVTSVTYKNNSGEIIEADILINDNFSFTTANTEHDFLGNVLTHELGHFLGLGHGQVLGSSMFYALSRGQSQLSKDDQAGLYSIYPNSDVAKASLTGKIIGGPKLTAVFGAHVEAISLASGKVEGASISDIDGSFRIDGLVREGQYHLYIKPIINLGLPSKYSTAKSNFCESNKSYRGSFFQSCGSSFEGFPQAVKLSAASVEVGNVTVRCGMDVPPDYLLQKGTTPTTFNVLENVISGVGNTFTGYFSLQEMGLAEPADYFRIDLSTLDPNSFSLTGDLYVELKVLNQSFYSPFKASVTVRRDSSTTIIAPKYVQENDGWINIETTAYIPINRLDLSDNDLEIKISPESMTFPSFPAGIPFIKSDLFPVSDFEDPLIFYLATVTIVRSNGDSTYTTVSTKQYQLTDNSQCADAVNTYALTNYTVNATTTSSASSRKSKDDGILGCGSVDLDAGNGHGGGPTGFLFGIILSLLFCALSSKMLNRHNSRTI